LTTEDISGKAHFFDYLSTMYLRGDAAPLHCFVLVSSTIAEFEEIIEHAKKRGLKAILAPSGRDLHRLRIGVRTSYSDGYLVEVDGNWVFFTDGETSRVTSTVGSFVRRMMPLLRLAYVPSASLIDAIGRISRDYTKVLLTEGTICSTGETYRNWKKEPVTFSIKEAHRQAAREGGKWSSISVKCYQDDKEVLNCRFYERGHLTLYSGDYSHFYSNMVLPYVLDAVSTSDKMRGRERSEVEGEVLLHPLSFEFARRKISSHDMELLREKILNKYSAAVMHPGNPMLQIQLNDRDDGSGFDLYVFNTKIQIVPLQKSTPAALSELVELVSDVLPTGSPEMV